MELDEIKAAIKNLTKQDRRKLALFILELEKQHVQDTVGPQIAEDLETFSRLVQDSVEKLKKHVKDKW